MIPTTRPRAPKPIAVHARYVLKHPRITTLIPKHFTDLDETTKKVSHGTGFNRKALYEYMGIPAKRFDAIVKGAMPMLHEVEAYADYFKIDISELYEVVKPRQNRKAA